MGKGGRPTMYSKQLADKICERIAEGYSLRQIEELDGMPSKTQILKWATDSDKLEFTDQYSQAMQRRTEYWAEEILDICDDSSNDWMERENKDGSTYEVINSEAINRSRLRVDARKWLMSKLAPKKYGEKIQQEITGKEGSPLQAVIEIGPKPKK